MTDPRPRTREDDALRAAQMYYLQDITMEAIARELRTSRSTVSRLLASARETGLVQITVQSPRDVGTRIERGIRQRHGVTAHVVPVPDRIAEVDRLERVARSAARMLSGLVDSNMTIGIAWGATLSAVGRHLPTTPTHNTAIVQMNGAANVRTSGLVYAGEILDRFAAAFTAEAHQFPVPALFDDPATKAAMWRERSVRRVLDLQRRMDLAVFGLGAPDATVPSHVYAGDYFDPTDERMLRESGIVGDVASVFYRVDGSADLPINERSSGPGLDALRRVPRRFCVVSGTSKLDSLRGALAAGVITDLVVDERTARHLLTARA